MNDYKWKIDCDISPRELSYALSEFHRAPSGDGALGFTWQDKPHRIVYDLIAAVKYYAMRVAELESRLEISPLHNVDGIMARDATIKLQDEYIAKLESERAEREKQKPAAFIDDDECFQGPCRHATAFVPMPRGTPLYAAPPVTAPGEQKLGLLSGCVTKSAMALIDAAAQNIGKVTVTTDANGRAVAVTRTDDDGRILGVIWSAPVTAPVRLTDKQIYAIAEDDCFLGNVKEIARAVEDVVLRANGFKVEE